MNFQDLKIGDYFVYVHEDSDGEYVEADTDLTKKVKAGDLVNMVAEQVGGKGGGRPDMAMAGGTDTSAVTGALDSVKPWLEEKL